MMCMSLGGTGESRTRTRISPGPGFGSGNSRTARTSLGLPVRSKTNAFINAVLLSSCRYADQTAHRLNNRDVPKVSVRQINRWYVKRRECGHYSDQQAGPGTVSDGKPVLSGRNGPRGRSVVFERG